MTDLLTVGESMIRLSAQPGDLLLESSSLNVNVGGAESNVAVAVAHMGFQSRWLSRLTDNVLGRRIAQELTNQGVDCSGILWTNEDRVGTYFIEFGQPPRLTRVTYDRVNSAASKMGPDTFVYQELANTRILHLTGITAAISDSCYAMVNHLLDAARRHKIHVVFDVNFRAKLWSAEMCAAKVTPLLDRVDTLILSRADATLVFGIQGDPEHIIRDLDQRFNVPQIALTISDKGAIGLENDAILEAQGYPVTILDRIGAGDSFAAGVICGLLRDDFALGLRYGVAMSALQLSLRGDMFRLSSADVSQLMSSEQPDRPLR
jgi:2-dehydro-3-deoxygluconokinase